MDIKRIKILTISLFILTLSFGPLSSSAHAVSRGITVKAKTSSGTVKEIPLYSGYYALVIGCGNYQKGWPKLPNPVKDAREVSQMLKDMGWTVDLLEDPDWEQLDIALNTLITGPGRIKDQATLVWFSGHGHTLGEADGTQLGYIVPVDAPRPGQDEMGFMRKAIDMRQMETISKRIQSKHVLMLFDSCFSGAIFSMVRANPSDYIKEKVAQPVRQFITAGSENEQVPDRSVFKTCFIQGIKDGDADLNRDGYVTGEEIGSYLEEKVVNYSHKGQHPQYGKINNPKLDKGDFVFLVPDSSPTVNTTVKTEETDSALEADRKQLELERQELERLKIDFERQKLETEKQQLAAEQKRVMEAGAQNKKKQSVQLAAIPDAKPVIQITSLIQDKKPTGSYLKKMINHYGFYEKEKNPFGSFDNDFVDNQDGTITDRRTGLVWQKGGSLRSLLKRRAKRYVEMLNREKFAGHSDWRFPTVEELVSLLEQSNANGVHIDPLFGNTQERCWSSHEWDGNNPSFKVGLLVSFSGGKIMKAAWLQSAESGSYGRGVKMENNFVRAVRSLNK